MKVANSMTFITPRFGFSKHQPPDWDRCLFMLKDSDFRSRKQGVLKHDVLSRMARCLPRKTAADSPGFFAVTNLDELFDSREDMLRFYSKLIGGVFRRSFWKLGCRVPVYRCRRLDDDPSPYATGNNLHRGFHWDADSWPFAPLLYLPEKNIRRNGIQFCDALQFFEDRGAPHLARSNRQFDLPTLAEKTGLSAEEEALLRENYSATLDWSPEKHQLVVVNNRRDQGTLHANMPVEIINPENSAYTRYLYRWEPYSFLNIF